MKKYSLILGICIIIPYLLTAQGGIVNDGASIKVVGATNLKIDQGGMIHQNNGSISNEGSIFLDQDWMQYGTSTTYTGSGQIVFEGSTHQQISGLNTLANVSVDNGNYLMLQNELTVTSSVDLHHNGMVELNNHDLKMAAGTSLSGYDATHYIMTNGTGSLQREVGATNVIFPVGNNTYNPATLHNSGTTDNFKVRVVEEALTHGNSGTAETEGVVNRTWEIEEEIVGGSDVQLTLQWVNTSELPNFDRANSGIAHWNGSAWEEPIAYTNATNVGTDTWTQSGTNISSFSPFRVQGATQSLPIELLLFTADRLSSSSVQLDWTTSLELNNQGFEIERMLEGETTFTTLGFVEGAGTTNEPSNYAFVDENASPKVSYYRLKQVDFDGAFAYSEIREVKGLESGLLSQVSVYPNPVQDFMYVQFGVLPEEINRVHLELIDMHGHVLNQSTVKVKSNETISLQGVEKLALASYLLSIRLDDGQKVIHKFVKR